MPVPNFIITNPAVTQDTGHLQAKKQKTSQPTNWLSQFTPPIHDGVANWFGNPKTPQPTG